jgi:hypothetical protein
MLRRLVRCLAISGVFASIIALIIKSAALLRYNSIGALGEAYSSDAIPRIIRARRLRRFQPYMANIAALLSE